MNSHHLSEEYRQCHLRRKVWIIDQSSNRCWRWWRRCECGRSCCWNCNSDGSVGISRAGTWHRGRCCGVAVDTTSIGIAGRQGGHGGTGHNWNHTCCSRYNSKIDSSTRRSHVSVKYCFNSTVEAAKAGGITIEGCVIPREIARVRLELLGDLTDDGRDAEWLVFNAWIGWDRFSATVQLSFIDGKDCCFRTVGSGLAVRSNIAIIVGDLTFCNRDWFSK